MIETTKQNIKDLKIEIDSLNYLIYEYEKESMTSYDQQLEKTILKKQLKLWQEKLAQEEELIKKYEAKCKKWVSSSYSYIDAYQEIIKDIKGVE